MLNGKIAVVTGAGRGIGKAIALKLARQGAKVVVNYYMDNLEQVEAIVQEIKDMGSDAISVMADVSKEADVKMLIDTVMQHYGKIDILVNNAGITKDGLLLKMSEQDYDAVLDINLKGTFLCLKYTSAIMLKQRSGKIINIASVIGLVGNIGQANYAASKAGVIGLTKASAKELASRGITVNAVAPGFIQTEMTDRLSDKVKEASIAAIPLKRMGSIEDVANAVKFLASEEADYITGQVLVVDGGMVM